MNRTTYTHKGWFFMCPVYLNADEGEGMAVTARWPWLDWWFDANEALFRTIAMFSQHEEPFPFRVTGKLKRPVVMEGGDE